MEGVPFEFNCTPDTGTTQTVIAADVLHARGIRITEGPTKPLVAANGTSMAVIGEVTIKATTECNIDASLKCLVCTDMKNEILVSWSDLILLGILSASFPGPLPAVSRSMKENIPDSLERVKADFKDVLGDVLKPEPMVGPPMQIHMIPDVTVVPLRISVARAVPLKFQAEADLTLQDLVDRGVLARVKVPTDWCSPGMFVPKADNIRVRLVTDFKHLNKYVLRPVHPFPSAKDIIQAVPPDAVHFAKLDAVHGYFQLALAEESSFMTTFLLPQGRFRYLRSPMGLAPSSDSWCYMSDIVVTGLAWARKIVDDVLIWAKTLEELLLRVRIVLVRCRENRITISLKKLEIGKSITFAGHLISHQGIRPDPVKTEAISKFKEPDNVTDLRSFLGLANQLCFFIPDMTQQIPNLRELLKKQIVYRWGDQHQFEFDRLKKVLTGSLLVKPFDQKLDTVMLTDAARLHGLGYALIQNDSDGKGHRLIHCGSCLLNSAQRNYATIELECLGIQWAISKCDFYLRGLTSFKVLTDHRPLEGVFKKALHMVDNPRLQRLMEKLQLYSFDVVWTPGKSHFIADALSRAPVWASEDDGLAQEPATCAHIIESSFVAMAAKHEAYSNCVDAVLAGKTMDQLNPDHPARVLTKVWDRLSVDNVTELMLVDDLRIVVPTTARQRVLELLHMPHSGMAKTLEQARQLYYWPTMTNDIKMVIEKCEACHERLPSLAKEPLKAFPEDTIPMSHVGTDLFQLLGETYLVMVDRYSGFPFCQKLRNTATADVTAVMTSWFVDFGWPRSIRSDYGPQYRSEFDEFCLKNNIVHEVSSAFNARSNGLAESAVKSTKYLLAKCLEQKQDFKAALQEFRNCPRTDGASPAMMMFNRRQRTALPTLDRHHAAIDIDAAAAGREKTRIKLKEKADIHSISLKPFKIGDRVTTQHPVTKKWFRRATVSEIRDNGRSYIITSDVGKTYLRNRNILRLAPPHPEESAELDPPAADDANDIPPPRRRGRPLGSKAKVKEDAADAPAPRRSARNAALARSVKQDTSLSHSNWTEHHKSFLITFSLSTLAFTYASFNMGCPSSKPLGPQHTSLIDTSSSADDNSSSSGFHLFELHMPTMGMGFSMAFGLIVGTFFLIIAYKWCHGKMKTRPKKDEISISSISEDIEERMPFHGRFAGLRARNDRSRSPDDPSREEMVDMYLNGRKRDAMQSMDKHVARIHQADMRGSCGRSGRGTPAWRKGEGGRVNRRPTEADCFDEVEHVRKTNIRGLAQRQAYLDKGYHEPMEYQDGTDKGFLHHPAPRMGHQGISPDEYFGLGKFKQYNANGVRRSRTSTTLALTSTTLARVHSPPVMDIGSDREEDASFNGLTLEEERRLHEMKIELVSD